jgi:hypothetical protein
MSSIKVGTPDEDRDRIRLVSESGSDFTGRVMSDADPRMTGNGTFATR